MCPSFFASATPAMRAAHARHRGDPTILPYPPAGATLVAYTAPPAEAREQWRRLNGAGIFCLKMESVGDAVRMVYAVRKMG